MEYTIDVKADYTIAELSMLFEQMQWNLQPKEFARWVDEFWTTFSGNGGYKN